VLKKSSGRTRKADGENRKAQKPRRAQKRVEWDLRLYIAGETPRAAKALQNLELICKEHLDGRYRLTVVDLLKAPRLARGDQIIAVPTLVRRLPAPFRKIVGDLSDTEWVLIGLDLRVR
jgi:circadian clock protein KaiB